MEIMRGLGVGEFNKTYDYNIWEEGYWREVLVADKVLPILDGSKFVCDLKEQVFKQYFGGLELVTLAETSGGFVWGCKLLRDRRAFLCFFACFPSV